MTTKTVLTDDAIRNLIFDFEIECDYAFSRAIEQAVLNSPEIQALKRDKERLDWLAYVDNRIGNVQLPTACVERNLHSLRGAIDDAMEQKNERN